MAEELDELVAAERRELRALMDSWTRRVERRRQEHTARLKRMLRRTFEENFNPPPSGAGKDLGEAASDPQARLSTVTVAAGMACDLHTSLQTGIGVPVDEPAETPQDPTAGNCLKDALPQPEATQALRVSQAEPVAGRRSSRASQPQRARRVWASTPAPATGSPTLPKLPSGYLRQTGAAKRKRRWSVFSVPDGVEDGRTWAQRLVQSRGYEWASLALILSNVVFIGFQTEWIAHTARHLAERGLAPNASEPTSFVVVQCIFCLLFVAELGLRWRADGSWEFFVHAPDRRWNLFDSFIVALSLVDMTSSLIARATEDSRNMFVNISVLRVVRVVRVIRVAKVIRVMRFFRELRMMVYSVLASVKSLLWAAIVLLLMFFIFGISLTVGAVHHMDSPEAWQSESTKLLRQRFGTLSRSIVTLYGAMSGGRSWGPLYDTLWEISGTSALLFLFFVTVAIFAVGNVVTGIFVDHAMQASQKDKDFLIQNELEARKETVGHLQAVFEEIDADGTGLITLDEFEAKLDDKRALAFFKVLNLEVGDARMLFTLLDHDQSGDVAIEEFVAGVHKLKGESRSLDLAIMQFELRWLREAFVNFADFVETSTARAAPRTPRQAHELEGGAAEAAA